MKRLACAMAVVLAGRCCMAAENDEFILKAMKDEIQRLKTLRLPGLEAPYFATYLIEDADLVNVSAMLGALVSSTHSPLRVQNVKVRVGDYNFDNTNYLYSEVYSGARYDTEQLPLETNYLGLRNILWLATDRAFKTAEEAIARKKSALKNVSVPDTLPDFTKAEVVHAVEGAPRRSFDEAAWKKRTVDLSSMFTSYPDVQSSSVEFNEVQSTDYLVNSEGTEVKTPDNLAMFRIRAYGQAADGYSLRDTEMVEAADVNSLPSEAVLRRAVTEVAEDVKALVHAPAGNAYDGPVLFEGRAAAQLFGQVLGDSFKLGRKPVGEPGRPVPYLASELESRVGSRILPDWMDIVDDPLQKELAGQRLLGYYQFDLEGVRAKPVTLVEHGVLKDFLRTRTPALKGFEGSNGHARLPGSYGAAAAGIGNLIVKASQTVPAADLKKKLIELCKQRNKPYGIIVRKLDWPSSATFEELRRQFSNAATSGARPVSVPLLVYRVDMEGKEELIRGVRFRGLNARSFKDILAAADQPYVYNYMDSTAPFAMMGAASFITNSTVIAPAVLFDELELEQVLDEMPKPPIVPAPTTD